MTARRVTGTPALSAPDIPIDEYIARTLAE